MLLDVIALSGRMRIELRRASACRCNQSVCGCGRVRSKDEEGGRCVAMPNEGTLATECLGRRFSLSRVVAISRMTLVHCLEIVSVHLQV